MATGMSAGEGGASSTWKQVLIMIFKEASIPHLGVFPEGEQLGRGDLPGGGQHSGQFLDQLGHYDRI